MNTLNKVLTLALASTLSFNVSAQPTQCSTNTTYNIGAGIYDITGPAAEMRMMGYAMLNQSTEGILSRLWARAFVIESPCNNKRVVFVNADLGMVFQAVKEQVVKELQKKYGALYNDDNVLITATHDHSGPGGFSTYTLYNLTILGFSRDNFNTIVNGIVAAIDRAHANVKPATIKIAKGDLTGISFNRSPQSYELNPATERATFAGNVDTEMTLMRFDGLDGKPIGMINWFPIHGVSENNKNHLINGDNKGYAEYLFEKDFQSHQGPSDFVAAFAQANAGDVSPNAEGHEGGAGLEGLEAVEKAGRPQYETAKRLYESATEAVAGDIDFRHQFLAFDKVSIAPQFTDGQPQTTCPPAIGVSMLAGTTDGEGFGKQGVTCDNVSGVIPGLFCAEMTTTCQGAKPIALELGNKKPYPWVPTQLPFQEFKIGNVIIAAAPFEITTMSGRRIKKSIQAQLPANQNYHVVISALSNAYVQYMATHEEYQLQRYEGASTVFGPWAVAALQQTYSNLTNALMTGNPVAPGDQPIDLLDSQHSAQMGVVFDRPPMGKNFGDVSQDVKPMYLAGQTVQAIFWGGHPKNNFHTQDTYLEVQKLENGVWQTIRTDNDWDTEYHWARSGIASSLVTISWRIPKDAKSGQYRLVHHGDAKSFWSRKIAPYTGVSGVFSVV